MAEPSPESASAPRRLFRRPANLARPPRSRRRFLLFAAATAVLAVVVVTGTAAATGSGDASYRTAAVVTGTVSSTVNATGTIAPANQAALSFPISGTVAAVAVAIGQQVAVGQPLAGLNTTSLQSQVASAQATLATAQNRLASDEAGQSSASGSAASGPSAGQVVPAAFVTGTGSSKGSDGGSSDGSGSLADLQAQLVADQHSADLALTAEKSAVDNETAACAATGGGTTSAAYVRPAPPSTGSAGASSTPTPTADPAPTSDPAPTTDPAPTSSPAPTADPPNAATHSKAPAPSTSPAPSSNGGGRSTSSGTGCQDAISSVLAQQLTVSQDLQNVATDEAALSKAIAAGNSTAQSGTPAPSGQGGQNPPAGQGGQNPAGSAAGATPGGKSGGAGTSAGGSGGGAGRTGGGQSGGGQSGGGGGKSGGSTPVSAEQLASDQATIDADSAAVTVAQQSLDQATMVSPISGTVGAITVKPGQSVSAGSAAQITVLGPGTEQVTISVNDIAVGGIAVGAPATVTPSGSSTPLPGTVTSVGVKNTSTGSSPSYPVVIGLTGTPPQLPDGQGAAVSVVTAKVDDVVAVPTSAVHAAGAAHTVTVLASGKPTPTRVEIGAVGPLLTQVTSGLQPGQQVVLADLSQPLPTATTGARAVTGGGGAPGGGARPGG